MSDTRPSAPPAETTLYPSLPTASDAGNTYRLQKISEIEAQLRKELEARESLYKKYQRAVNGLDGMGNACSAVTVATAVSGVALLSTIVAVPAGIALEGTAAICGGVTIAGRVVSRRLNKKAQKHDRIRQSVETVLRTISQITSRALRDGAVSGSEYQLVLDEAERFATLKEEIRRDARSQLQQQEAELQAQLDARLEEARKRGREEGREDTLKKIRRATVAGDS